MNIFDAWLLIALFVCCSSSAPISKSVPTSRNIPGLQTPLTIQPVVSIPDSQWLLDAYLIVFNRTADEQGFRVNFGVMQTGTTRQQIFDSFILSEEWKNNPALSSRTGFAERLYSVILTRTGSEQEVQSWVNQLQTAQGSGPPGTISWVQAIEDFYLSQEFANKCPTEYFTLGSRVNADAILLMDLFNGTARMQNGYESTYITLTVPTAQRLWDQKLPIWYNPFAEQDGYPLIAFTRAFLGGNDFTITVLQSNDALHFVEIGPLYVNLPSSGVGYTVYDPHLSVDYSVCPPRYVLAMECAGNSGTASLCTSFSTYPSKPFTWSKPFVLVDGCAGGKPTQCGTVAAESASTGVLLHDGSAKYAAWSQVYDGVGPNDPQVHTYSQNTGPLPSLFSYFGTVMGGTSPIDVMMSSEPKPFCTDAWDCNDRDKQDWKKEADYYYALYNGANYYRCNGLWGISVARSKTAVGPEYTDRLPLSQGIPAVVNNTCGISYPVLNVIDGEIYIYYAWVNATGNHAMRSKLVPL